MSRCFVRGCEVFTPRDRLMCPAHWRQVPDDLQRAVWREYRRGLGRRWMEAAVAARDSVENKWSAA